MIGALEWRRFLLFWHEGQPEVVLAEICSINFHKVFVKIKKINKQIDVLQLFDTNWCTITSLFLQMIFIIYFAIIQ